MTIDDFINQVERRNPDLKDFERFCLMGMALGWMVSRKQTDISPAEAEYILKSFNEAVDAATGVITSPPQ